MRKLSKILLPGLLLAANFVFSQDPNCNKDCGKNSWVSMGIREGCTSTPNCRWIQCAETRSQCGGNDPFNDDCYTTIWCYF